MPRDAVRRGAQTRRILTGAELRAEAEAKFAAELAALGVKPEKAERGLADMPTRPGPSTSTGSPTRHV